MLNLKLSPEHRLVREMARRFAEREIEPVAADLDEHKLLPYDLIRRYIREVQGAGQIENAAELAEYLTARDFFTRSLPSIEISRVSPGLMLSLGASLDLAGFGIVAAGTREQVERWAVPLYRGDKIGAWGLTEPEAGSDAGAMKTVAKKDGDHYVLSGQKTFITNAPFADTFVVYAKAPGGVTVFALERGLEGLTTSAPFEKMGHRASPTGAIYLDGVRVPADHRLGAEGQGFSYLLNNLNHERAFITTIMIGIMERCLEESTRFAKDRVQFGKPIVKFQAIQFLLARSWEKLMASYSMLFTLGAMIEAGMDISGMAAAAKLFISEAATQVGLDAIQVMGGYGYMKEYKVERFMRDAKLLEIGAGTSQIQLVLLGRQLERMTPFAPCPLDAGPASSVIEPEWIKEVKRQK